MSDVVHTIPVPKGWSVEQAWEAINRGDKLPEKDSSWANVIVRNGVRVNLKENDE